MESFNYEDADNPDHIYNICIGATDPWEHQVDQQFIVRINDVNDAPVLVEPIVFDNVVDEHVSISFTVAATDEDEKPELDTLNWKLIGAPTGATILPASGLGLNATVSWIPDEGQGPDEYTFTVQVCDNDYDNEPPLQHILCDEALVTIIVNEVNEAPVANQIFTLGAMN